MHMAFSRQLRHRMSQVDIRYSAWHQILSKAWPQHWMRTRAHCRALPACIHAYLFTLFAVQHVHGDALSHLSG